MINVQILDIDVKDIRFPTSVKWKLGGNVMHTKLDHSCVYVIIKTTDTQYKGYGISCTSGSGNECVVQECKRVFEFIKNQTTREIFTRFLSFWRILTNQVETTRCVGLENSVTDLAATAIVNALWDLWARIEGKPVWKLLTDMTPEQLVCTVDFTNMAITEEDVIKVLKKNQPYRKEREKELQENGYPAYAADIGCWDYSCAKIRDHCKKYVKLQFDTFQVSITPSLEDNKKICSKVRKEISWKKKLLLGVNQIRRFENINDQEAMLQTIKPFSIEIPLLVNDLMIPAQLRGDFVTHYNMDPKSKPIRIHKTKLSYGETCANCDMFKQSRGLGADFWHVNVVKLGGINEALAIYFLALDKTRTDVSIWACAAGIGLGEMAQHLQIWDYICFSQTTKNRWIGFANYQHGYFENPVFIKNAHYMPPTLPGFSTKLKDKCIARWSYPEGTRWKHLLQIKRFEKDESGVSE